MALWSCTVHIKVLITAAVKLQINFNYLLDIFTKQHNSTLQMQHDVLTEIRIRNYLGNEGTVNLLKDIIHLLQFGRDEGTVGSADVTDVVEAKVVEDQNVPVISLEGAVQVAGHIVVNLHGQMMHKKKVHIY